MYMCIGHGKYVADCLALKKIAPYIGYMHVNTVIVEFNIPVVVKLIF